MLKLGSLVLKMRTLNYFALKLEIELTKEVRTANKRSRSYLLECD